MNIQCKAKTLFNDYDLHTTQSIHTTYIHTYIHTDRHTYIHTTHSLPRQKWSVKDVRITKKFSGGVSFMGRLMIGDDIAEMG